MRRELKNTKGITLIALVVTIIVLLILAGVTINAVFGKDGIIQKAQDAQNRMDQATQNDLDAINGLNEWIDGKINGTTRNWIQNKTSVTNGTTTYTVGDDYTYDCGVSGYTGGWKVLGAENGKLLIMSTVDVGTLGLKGISGDGTTDYPAGYSNGIEKLDEMCAPYGTNARSITVEDINRVTGYIPKHQTISITSENKYYYDNDTSNQSSIMTGTNAAYAGTYGLATALGTTDGSPVTGKAYYSYNPSTLSSDETTVEIEKDSSAYKLLFRNEDNTANCIFWIASSCVQLSSQAACMLSMRVTYEGFVSSGVLWHTTRGVNSCSAGVRAVIPL